MKQLTAVSMFRTGDYGDKGKYGPEELDLMAASYDPDYLSAPITRDHEQVGRAFGWISRVYRQGDLLMGDWQVLDDTYEMIREGQYTRRSIEFYRKHQMPDGREVPYVKACSILGAATPHAKGMPPIRFSESAGESIAIDFSEKTLTIPKGLITMTQNPLTAKATDRLVESLLEKKHFTSRLEAEEFAKTCKAAPGQIDRGRIASHAHSKSVAELADKIAEANPDLSPLDAAMQAQKELLAVPS